MTQYIMKCLIVGIGILAWLAWPSIGKQYWPAAQDDAERSAAVDFRSMETLGFEYFGASQDTFVATSVGAPMGHLEELIAGHKAVDHVALLQFELPDRGPDVRVISARLELFCITVEEDPDPSNQLEISNVARKWDEDVVTRIPNAVGPKFDYDIEGCEVGGEWKTIEHEDLLKTVSEWYTGGIENHGLAIGPTDSDSTRLYRFVASNGEPRPPLGQGPRLVIEFAPSTSVPPATATAVPPDTATAPPSEEPEPAQVLSIPAAYNSVRVMGVISTSLPPSATPEPPSATPKPTDTPTPTATPTVTETLTATATVETTPPPEGTFCPPAPRCTPGPVPTRCSGRCPTPRCPTCER